MVDANRQYRVPHWGEGYFRVGSNGEFVVQPDADEQTPGIVLADVIRAARKRNLGLPLLVRFNDILRHRVASLDQAFGDAISACKYAAAYHPIYPIKVNQQRSVVETIAGCAGAGFECGSKPELMVVLAASQAGGIIVCNGYKDRDYIRLGLIATRMGYRCYLVLEKLSELDLLIDDVEALADGGILSGGQVNRLIVKIDATIASLDRGNTTAACNELQAFIDQVGRFVRAGTLTPDQGQSLIVTANSISVQNGC